MLSWNIFVFYKLIILSEHATQCCFKLVSLKHKGTQKHSYKVIIQIQIVQIFWSSAIITPVVVS